jgi:ribonuclease HII
MNLVVGIDEVGRGCLAGPLVAAAVLLTRNIPGLNDSKQLSRGQREALATQISKTAKVGIGWISAEEIDSSSD